MVRMPRLRTTNGIFLIVLLATIGFLLIYVPNKVIELYDRVKELGSPYIYLYWCMVGTGAAILLVLAGATVAKLWHASREKSDCRERGAKNPSQLSVADQER